MNLFVALKTGVLNKSPGWRMTRKGTKLAEIIISCKKDGIQFNEQMFLDVLDLLKFNPAQRERKLKWFLKNYPPLNKRVLIGNHTREEWEQKKQQYDYRCFYCGRKKKSLTKDHLVPVSRGGVNTIDNIVPACRKCNSAKNTKPVEIFKPDCCRKMI